MAAMAETNADNPALAEQVAIRARAETPARF